MNKATVTSPEAMREEQILKDVSMTPAERLELAFRISDFALSLQQDRATSSETPSSIQWFELDKIPVRK